MNNLKVKLRKGLIYNSIKNNKILQNNFLKKKCKTYTLKLTKYC